MGNHGDRHILTSTNHSYEYPPSKMLILLFYFASESGKNGVSTFTYFYMPFILTASLNALSREFSDTGKNTTPNGSAHLREEWNFSMLLMFTSFMLLFCSSRTDAYQCFMTLSMVAECASNTVSEAHTEPIKAGFLCGGNESANLITYRVKI